MNTHISGNKLHNGNGNVQTEFFIFFFLNINLFSILYLMHVKIIRGIVRIPSDLNPSNICDIFRGFGSYVNNIHV